MKTHYYPSIERVDRHQNQGSCTCMLVSVFDPSHIFDLKATLEESPSQQKDMILDERLSEPFPIPPRPLLDYIRDNNKINQTSSQAFQRFYIQEHAPRHLLSPEQNHLVWVRVKKKVPTESLSRLGLVVDEFAITFDEGDVFQPEVMSFNSFS